MYTAILTADLINSSKYSNEEWSIINSTIHRFISKWNEEQEGKYEMYRGDSIQGKVTNISMALHHAIYLKALIKSTSLPGSKRTTKADIRIAIGIGETSFLGDKISESQGEAFLNSGRTLDKISKQGRTIAMKTPAESLNREWSVILTLLDELMERWTLASADIVWRTLEGNTISKIATALNISKSAISQRRKIAGLDAVEDTLKYFEYKFSNFHDSNIS